MFVCFVVLFYFVVVGIGGDIVLFIYCLFVCLLMFWICIGFICWWCFIVGWVFCLFFVFCGGFLSLFVVDLGWGF